MHKYSDYILSQFQIIDAMVLRQSSGEVIVTCSSAEKVSCHDINLEEITGLTIWNNMV
jgi:hypothetical protein